MNHIAELLNQAAQAWWVSVVHATWQSALVAGVILLAVWMARRLPSPLRYGLVLLVLVKFAVPPFWTLPTGLLSQFQLTVPREAGRTMAARPTERAEEFAAFEREPMDVGGEVRGPSGTGLPLAKPTDLRSQWQDEHPVKATSVRSWMSLRSFDWRVGCMLLHFAGVLVVGAWIARQYWRIARIIRSAQAVTCGPLYESFRQAADRLGLRRSVRLMVCSQPIAPLAFGVVRRVVLVPSGLLDQLSTNEQQMLVAHELAHHRRRDLWVLALQAAVVSVWWFNPFAWLVNRALIRMREECCDDLLLCDGMASSNRYSQTLLHIVEWCSVREVARSAVWFASRMHPLGVRITRVMDSTLNRSARLSLMGTAILFATATVVLPGMAQQTSSPDEIRSPSPTSHQSDRRHGPQESVEDSNHKPIAEERVDVYGDPLPRGAIARLGTVRYRKFGDSGLHFLADSKTLVGGSSSGSLWFMDRDSGRVVREVAADMRIGALTVSPDRKTIAAVGRPDQTETLDNWALVLWDASTGERRKRVTWVESRVSRSGSLAFSPDGKTIATACDRGRIRFWDVDSCKESSNHAFLNMDIRNIAFSPDGSMLGIVSYRELFLWDWRNAAEPYAVADDFPDFRSQSIAWSPDGKVLAFVGGGRACELRFLEVSSKRTIEPLDTADRSYYPVGMAFSSDGKSFVVPCFSNRSIEVWDMDTGRLAKTFGMTPHRYLDSRLSPDDQWLAVSNRAFIEVWNLRTGKAIGEQFIGHRGGIYEMVLSLDGASVVTGGADGNVRVWDARSGRHLRGLAHGQKCVTGLDISPNGERIASMSMDDTTVVWDAETGQRIFELPGDGNLRAATVRITSDAHRLLTFGRDMVLRAWNLQTGDAIVEHRLRPSRLGDPALAGRNVNPFGAVGEGPYPENATFTVDGKLFLLSLQGILYLFDVESGKELSKSEPSFRLDEFGISRDARRLVTKDVPQRGTGAYLHVRDLRTKKVLAEIELQQRSPGNLTISANGRFIAMTGRDSSASETNHWIDVWETETGRHHARITGFTSYPHALAFSPDGKRIASTHFDTTVLVWGIEQFRVQN